MSDQVEPEVIVVEDAAAEADAVGLAPERPGEFVERSAERAVDHAAIAQSIDELLPALIAKLGATGLAELEIRQDALHVRLRRPADGTVTHDRRAGDRARGDRTRSTPSHIVATHTVGLTAVGPGRDTRESREVRVGGETRDSARVEEPRAIATSPAVGIYHPRSESSAGTRVRAGDRLGTVDMLGVPQEVVAPTDGLVGASLVDPGEAVEYGQELVVIEFVSSPSAGSASAPSPTKSASTPRPSAMDH